MRSKGAADDCLAPQSGLLIGDGWGVDDADGVLADDLSTHARLEKVVRENIVPRLALIHQQWRSEERPTPPNSDDIEEFGRIVVGPDPALANQFFERMRQRGLTVDALFENLLAPTARRLGELWFEDICDFVDVAVGVNRLRILLEMYSEVPRGVGDSHRRALLVSTPNERHMLGLDIVASFLRASGWDTVMEIGRSAEDNARAVAGQWFAIAGVTISKEANLANAARAIEAMRRASLNPSISIMIGGWVCRGRPDLVARLGADATAEDGPGAALLAQRLYIDQSGQQRRA
jgi:MerR family transcriptional regulator, light-induced transcriptional regulator